MNQDDMAARLMAENEEFRRLRTEHQSYDQELAALTTVPSLSADQHWRISELKKLKLMAKDRMEAIARQTRASVGA
ncbi:MAG: YdcH family protein [Candidatus Rokuibacteriota bacterium]